MSTEKSSAGPQLRSGPLITGAALFGAGALIALAGLAVGGSHLMSATRRWIRDMEVPPSELAKLKWSQARPPPPLVPPPGRTGSRPAKHPTRDSSAAAPAWPGGHA